MYPTLYAMKLKEGKKYKLGFIYQPEKKLLPQWLFFSSHCILIFFYNIMPNFILHHVLKNVCDKICIES